jgi:two-component system cell cycle response regulator CpdR
VGRVLVADDEPAFAEFVRRVVAGRGHTVVIAQDGAEAARALDLQAFDLLLADIRMPVMDGITLALQVADRHPETKVVLVTGFADERDRARGLEAFVARVLAKPLMPEELLAVVDALVPGADG